MILENRITHDVKSHLLRQWFPDARIISKNAEVNWFSRFCCDSHWPNSNFIINIQISS